MQAQQTLHLIGGAIAKMEPDYLWRETLKRTQFTEISIFCHHQIAILTPVFPNFHIVGMV